jgi:predicted TIM-barrel fold metal-dependent hydrolase
MQIAINRQASDGVNLMSSGSAIDGLDRSHSIVDSADIHASHPNCKFAPSLIYHSNAMAINKYVEAEQRTVFAAPYKCAIPSARMGHYRGKLTAERTGRVSLSTAAGAGACGEPGLRRRKSSGAMNINNLVAIDVHTHAEVSCRQPADAFWEPYEAAASDYFKVGKRPTISETITYYRDRKIGLIMFTVDSEFEIGARRISNDEVAEAAAANADIMMAFASIDPHKGKMGAREARDLIEAGVIKGFKFHPTLQGFFPNDRMAYGLYEVIAEHKLPAIFHSGHSGIGTGMPGGGGLRLKYSNPIHIDDVAADFPDMTIIIAHPSWPWQDEALSVCLHKPNVYIDLSGWSPKYFPPQLVRYANSQLKTKMLFGSDFPLIRPDRWIDDFLAAGFKPEVHDLILKRNAIQALKLDAAA